MSSTYYHTPRNVTQRPVDEDSISWFNDNQISAPDPIILNPTNPDLAGYFSTTRQELYRIAMRDSLVRVNSANQLWCTDFNFLNLTSIIGVELRLVTQRLARIQDYNISLLYQGQLIGENKSNDFAENIQLYGGPSDMWLSNLTSVEIQDPTFGVMIQVGPNKKYPHSDQGYINSVQLKVYFE